MSASRTISFGGSCLALAIALAGPAQAATATESASQQSSASADSAAEGDSIVVTARRREESAQDVPISLSVATGAELERRSVFTIADLERVEPGIRFGQATNSASAFVVSLRGQANPNLVLNQDNPVGMYVDGVYYARAVGLDASDLLDLERIEVLKGPQGTLFGRNTTGGAVSVVTKAPVDEFEGFVRGRIGSYNDIAIGGMVNVPLGAGAALRLVANHADRDGFGRNVLTGTGTSERRSTTLRASLKIDFGADATLILRGDYSKYDGTMPALRSDQLRPGSTGGLAAARELGIADPAVASAAVMAQLNALKFHDAALDIDSLESNKAYGASATLTWDLAEGVSFRSINAYRKLSRVTANDLDGTPIRIIGYREYEMSDRWLSTENHLFGTIADKLDWIVGAFYFHEKGREEGAQEAVPILSPTSPAIQAGALTNISKSLFAQATYRITDWLSATGGARHSWDTRKLTSFNRNRATCNALGVTLASLGAAPCERVLPTLKSKAWSYTASIELRPIEDVMLYVKTSRGYRAGGQAYSGGSGVSPAAAATSFTPFLPEFVTDYEVGLKSEWLDRKLQVNLAYFHSNYTNIQRSVALQVPGGGGATVSAVQNIGEAKIDGVEAEVTIRPFAGFELAGNLAYNDARYTRDVPATAVYPYTPKWSYGLNANYTVDVPFGRIQASADWFHKGFSYDAAIVSAELPAHDVLNARLSVRVDAVDAEVAVFVKNLANERYFTGLQDLIGAGLGTRSYFAAPPRTWGVELRKDF